MADIYVNAATGANGNAGTSEAPIQSLALALAQAGASDTVIVAGGDDMVYRTPLLTYSACTVRPATSGDYIHVLPSVDVSEGATRKPILYGGDGETWVDANTLYDFPVEIGTALDSIGDQTVGSSTITRSTSPRSGSHAFRMTRVGTDTCAMQFRMWKLPGEAFTATFWLRLESGSSTIRVQLSSEAVKYWDNTNQLWSDGVINNTCGGLTGSYQQFTISFPADTDPAGFAAGQQLFLRFNVTSNDATVDVDDVVVTGETSTYSWAVDTGDTYVLTNFGMDDSHTSVHMLKCSSADWTTYKADGLRHVGQAADLATCRSTPGSYYYDASTPALYYTLAAGESIGELHLEYAIQAVGVDVDHAVDGVGLVIHGSQTAVDVSAAAEFTDSHVCDTAPGVNEGKSFSSSANAVYNDCTIVRADGPEMGGAGVFPTLNHVLCVLTWDDGFQAINGAGYQANGCASLFNGQEGKSGNDAFSCEQDNSYMQLNGCLAYGCKKVGIRPGAGYGNSYVYNSMAIGNGTEMGGGAADVADNGSVNGTLTWDYNAYGTTGTGFPAAAGANDVSITTADIDTDMLDSVATMTNAEIRAWWKQAGKNILPADSACVGAGRPKWWTGPRPVSCSGEPIPDFGIDIGPQSTHGPFHPANL